MNKSLFALLLSLSIILASCGGNKLPTTIDLTMSDYKFTPDTITVPAGEEIMLNVTNKGFVSHRFVIFKLGTDAGETYNNDDEKNIYWSFEVLPGHSDSATFTAPLEAGEYFVTCGIHGHFEVGMVARLIVVAEK
jgi:uncharacterized cupredoxin-like copper-binding protein